MTTPLFEKIVPFFIHIRTIGLFPASPPAGELELIAKISFFFFPNPFGGAALALIGRRGVVQFAVQTAMQVSAAAAASFSPARLGARRAVPRSAASMTFFHSVDTIEGFRARLGA